MNKICQITRYLYTWQRLLWWFVTIGGGFLLAGVVVAIAAPDYPTLARFLFVVGLGCALFVPLVPMPTAIRDLLTNRNLKLLPGFHLAVGQAVLLQTCVCSAIAYTVSEFDGNAGLIAAAQTFIAISLYHTLMQRFLSSRLLPFLLIGLIFAFVGFIRVASDLSASGWLGTLPTLLAFGAICVAWMYVLSRLRRQTLFAHKPPDHMRLAVTWVNRTGQKLAAASPLGRLLGYPTNSRERFSTGAITILVAPVLAACFAIAALLLVGRLADKHPELRTLWILHLAGGITLMISLVNGLLASSTHALFKRTRLLWLRLAGTREDCWRLLEPLILANLATYFCVGLIMCLVVYPSSVARPFILNYLTAMLCGSLLSAYLSMNFALRQTMIGYGLTSAGLAVVFCYGLMFDVAVATWGSQIAALIMTWALRGQAKHAFAHIDWTTVRPDRSNRQKMTTVKLW